MCFYTGADVLASSMSNSFESLFSQAYTNIDAQVLGPITVKDPNNPSEGARRNLPETLVDRVRAVPGVREAHGNVFADGARVVGKDGKVIPTTGAPRFGSAWADGGDRVMQPGGHGPQAANEVVVNASLAEKGDFKVGDTIEVLTQQPQRPFKLVGIFEYTGGRKTLGGETVVGFTKTVAQDLMIGQRGVYTSIDVQTDSGVSQDKIRDDLSSALGGQADVLTQKQLIDNSTKGIAKILNGIKTGLQWFANIALFVGMFLILNTFSMLVTQRLRELALYRAMGASRRQIITAVLAEATIVGVVASLLGVALGVGVGVGLKALLQLLIGTELPNAGISLGISTVIEAMIFGTLATIVAALFPALRASRIPPIAAMRDAATPDRSLTRLTIAGLVLLVPGIGLLAYALAGNAGDNTLKILGLGGLIGFVGIALLTPLISKPVVQLFGRALSWNLAGLLGRKNSARNPRRTALTAAALMVGIALVTGGSVVASSVKQSYIKIFAQGVSADLTIAGEQTSQFPPTFDPAVLEKVRKIDGVSSTAGMSIDYATIGGKQAVVAATDLSTLRQSVDLKLDSGSAAELHPGQILLSAGTAKQIHAKVGDSVPTQYSKGDPRSLTVVGILKNGPIIPGSLVSADDGSLFRSAKPYIAYVKLGRGANIDHVQQQVTALLTNEPEVTVQNQKDRVAQQASGLDQLVLILLILLALAIIIAVLGVINTLALSVIERTRELGLLRAVGMRRSQMGQMITVESVVIAVFGAVLGMAVGITLGAAIVHALNDGGITELSLPWAQMVIFLVAAVIAGLLAAILPAIRAAKLNVLNAIAYE
jgi:putative ABC transport system permease protein